MSHRTALAVAAVAATASIAVAAPAHAEDQRPCVSMPEFRTAPGMSYITGKTNPGPVLTRRQLERVWDVRGLGVIDPELTDAHGTFWMYSVCGYSFDKAQVWVIVSAAGKAGAAVFWHTPGYKYVPEPGGNPNDQL